MAIPHRSDKGLEYMSIVPKVEWIANKRNKELNAFRNDNEDKERSSWGQVGHGTVTQEEGRRRRGRRIIILFRNHNKWVNNHQLEY